MTTVTTLDEPWVLDTATTDALALAQLTADKFAAQFEVAMHRAQAARNEAERLAGLTNESRAKLMALLREAGIDQLKAVVVTEPDAAFPRGTLLDEQTGQPLRRGTPGAVPVSVPAVAPSRQARRASAKHLRAVSTKSVGTKTK